MGDGRMDPKDVAILQGIGAWWKVNGESIRGTTRTSLPVQTWGESTRKSNTLYLHVFNWPTNGQLVVGGLKSAVKKAWLLSDPQRTPLVTPRLNPIYDVRNPLDVTIRVPAKAPGAADSVIVVECNDDIATDSARLLQPSFTNETLRVFDAQLHGKGLRFGPGKTRDAHVTGWTKADEFISWPVRLDADVAYDVLATYDAEPDSAGNTFALAVGDQQLKATVKAGAIRTVALGRISLKSGSSEIKVLPVDLKNGELMQLRTVELNAVTQ
jgi:hypothetical protein